MIINDKYSNDFTRMLEGASLETLFENVRRNHGHQRGDGIAVDQKTQSLPESTSATGMQYYDEYDRTAAVNYADTYWDRTVSLGPVPQVILDSEGWVPGWDENYKDYEETDCTNFTSQAVFEGVAYTASDHRYFYPDSTNYDEWWYYKFSDLADGSKPWISVGDFYTFLTRSHLKNTV